MIGDSLAYDNRPYLHDELPGWRIRNDFSFARTAAETAHDLRADDLRDPLPPVIHVSSGTGDDPEHVGRFRRAVRRVMRIAGPQRCVVWANVYRVKFDLPTFDVINLTLVAEAQGRSNLRLVDWHTMVNAHRDWLVDFIHVDAAGNRARAAAIAHEVHVCQGLLSAPELPGPLPP